MKIFFFVFTIFALITTAALLPQGVRALLKKGPRQATITSLHTGRGKNAQISRGQSTHAIISRKKR